MNMDRARGSRLGNTVLVIGAICLGAIVAVVAQQIPTGGRLPDRRLFQGMEDPRYRDVIREGLVTRHVAGKAHVIAGAGGNIVVQAGDDGVFLVDDNFTVFYDRIMTEIRRISDKPIRIVVNTHHHGDHLQNNVNMARQGALIVSHPFTRAVVMRGGRQGIPPAGWPTATTAEPMTFHFNGEDVRIVPLKPAHTGGDLAVYFTESDVWAFGDVYTQDYPPVGVDEGGTVDNVIDAYTLALEMTTPDTVFVAGHGQVASRADLIGLRDALGTIHERFLQMASDGMTLEQIRAARPSREFDPKFATENISPNPTANTDRFYQRLYEEVQAHLKLRQ